MTGAKPASAPRTRRPWRAVFFGLAGLDIIAGVGWALLGSRLLVVRSVTVTGTHLVSRAQVLAAADVPHGTSLIGVNTGQIARRVEAIRQVASASVAKDWPDRLVITVKERVPVVAVGMAGGGYDLVDPAGVVVRWAGTPPAGLPLYLTSLPGSALRGDQGLATAAAVLAELSPPLSGQITEVSVIPVLTGAGAAARQAYQVLLDLRDHKPVLWGGTDQAAEKNRELAILMRGGASYCDVSAQGIVVTK